MAGKTLNSWFFVYPLRKSISYIPFANVYFKTTIIKQNIKKILIAGVPSSQALPGFLITAPPSVCIPDVIGVLAVRILKKLLTVVIIGCSNQNNNIKSIEMGLGIFDSCAISRRLISKDSISSPNFSCGCSYVERALWCRDSKRRALEKRFFQPNLL